MYLQQDILFSTFQDQIEAWFEGKDIFEIISYFPEEKEFTWTMPDKYGNKIFDMLSYYHDEGELVNGLNDNGFIIERLNLIKPDKEMEKLNPLIFEFTSKFPPFIMIKARKEQ